MKLNIRSRKSWGARKPRARDSQRPANVLELFLHWPGADEPFGVWTPAAEERWMRATQDFHMDERGWADFAYSFAVFPSGRIYRGRGINWVPAAQENHNTNTVAVCVLVGPGQPIPEEIRRSLRALRVYVEDRCGRSLTMRPHSAVVSTTCPGPALTKLCKTL